MIDVSESEVVEADSYQVNLMSELSYYSTYLYVLGNSYRLVEIPVKMLNLFIEIGVVTKVKLIPPH
jgi:hypothetical protein